MLDVMPITTPLRPTYPELNAIAGSRAEGRWSSGTAGAKAVTWPPWGTPAAAGLDTAIHAVAIARVIASLPAEDGIEAPSEVAVLLT